MNMGNKKGMKARCNACETTLFELVLMPLEEVEVMGTKIPIKGYKLFCSNCGRQKKQVE